MRVVAIGAALAALVGCSAGPTAIGTSVPPISEARVSERAAAAVSDATGSALQGDAASALEILARVPEAEYAGDARAFRDCMLMRFGSAGPASIPFGEDPWIAALGQAYAGYWQTVLIRPTAIEPAEDHLAETVGKLLGRPMRKAAELDDAEPEIQAAVEAHGHYALLGRTPPLRELMLWKRQTTLQRSVDLPDGREDVQVMLLDDFLLRGWGHYATCGRRSAGGWTTDTALYAVGPAYTNLEDEEFSVRFLGHEAQHFADKRRYPGLDSWELEYRAKLVELSLGTYSQPASLTLFCENRADSKEAPHGYANARVIREIEQGLGIDDTTLCGTANLPAAAIRNLARKLLLEDSAARQLGLAAPGSPRAR